MKNNSSNLLFMNFMFMGILISISSNNWLGCWVGIEINLVSFLPIMLDKVTIYSSESMIKYFIIQSMGSSLFLMSIIMLNTINMEWLIMVSLMMKMGCPPFHLWYSSVMEGLSWKNCFILSTIQKFTLIILLSYLFLNMTLFILLSSIWGSVSGLSYSSMRKIIAYSSIYNLSWIISGLMMSNYSWLIYFLIYSFTLMMVCYLFFNFGVNYLNQFFLLSNSYIKSLLSMMIFMSMSGLPPFLGFFPKLIMIYFMVLNEMFFCCFVLIMTALLVMFFYLRIIFTGLMINSLSMKILIGKLHWVVYMFGLMSLFGIFLVVNVNLYI